MISDKLQEKRVAINKALLRSKNKRTYEKRLESKVVCESCAVEVDKYYFERHCESRRHKKLLDLNIV